MLGELVQQHTTFSNSLDDALVELSIEVRDAGDLLLEQLVVLGSRADLHAERVNTAVAPAWVNATDTVVLVLAHIRQMVGGVFHKLKVEEFVGHEGALKRDLAEVGMGFVDV